jgi:hypothetical protein
MSGTKKVGDQKSTVGDSIGSENRVDEEKRRGLSE